MVISYCHVSVISYCHVSPRYRADRVFYHITYPISTNLRLSHASVAGYKMSAKQINDYPSHSIAISFASITFASYHSTLLNSPATFAKCRQSLIKEVTGLLWELLWFSRFPGTSLVGNGPRKHQVGTATATKYIFSGGVLLYKIAFHRTHQIQRSDFPGFSHKKAQCWFTSRL